MDKCFADRNGECSALKIKDCDGCKFYKTKKEAERGRRQSLLRILSLDKNVKGHILEKYYGDGTRVEV